MNYQYFGQKFGAGKRTLTLCTAALDEPAAHVAVWYGANCLAGWVQAGIEQTYGEPSPRGYIEVGSGELQVHYEDFDWQFGWPLEVQVKLRNGRYRVVMHGRQSVAVPLLNPTVDSMLEVLGKARAVAVVNGHRIRGHST